MRKFILIPDSFKGTMSSEIVCNIMESAIKKCIPNSSVKKIPVADGGEGTVDALLQAVGGEKIFLTVKGPYLKDVNGFYGILPDGTAIIEMAAAAGLPLVGSNLHAELTTTYGVGQLIEDAVNHGCKKIILGLGGSCTNDGGCGMAVALGIRFFNNHGKEFLPTGQNLHEIGHIDVKEFTKKYAEIEFSAMCDIDNPLCGKMGAAHVFAPQKGADEDMVEFLDKGLAHLAEIIKINLSKDVLDIPGAGAAGGMGAGVVGFLNGKLTSGINSILAAVHFEKLLQNADCVFTGEGKIDYQSLHGKTIMGIAECVQRAKVPLIAVVGCIGEGIEPIYDKGVTAVFSINTQAMAFEQSAKYSEQNLSITMKNILRILNMNIG